MVVMVTLTHSTITDPVVLSRLDPVIIGRQSEHMGRAVHEPRGMECCHVSQDVDDHEGSEQCLPEQ